MAITINQPMIADNFTDTVTPTASTSHADHAAVDGIDNDKLTYWGSDGSDDLTQEEYLMTLSASKSVDFIYLWGMNFKQFKVQYWTGAAYADIADTVKTAWTDSYFVIRLDSPIASDKFKLVIDTTQVANAEKKLTEAILGGHRLNIWYDEFKTKDIELAGVHRLAKGRADQWQEWQKDGWTIELQNISLADIAILNALKDEYEDFVWYPEPELYPDGVFLVEWMNKYGRKYTSKFKGAGSTIELKLEEK